MKTILIIEDDKDINEMLSKLFKYNDYQVKCAYSGTEGILVHNDKVDLILLDLMLPGKSGAEIIKELQEKHKVPIIVMSAIHEINTKLNLFELGADDYITKPFNNEELLARIKVQLKHYDNSNISQSLSFKDIKINLNDFTVTCNGKNINLSKTEFDLLKTMMQKPNQVHTKSYLYDTVWNYEDSADDNTLNVHISKLRNKLKENNPNEEYIETIWGIGYKLKNKTKI